MNLRRTVCVEISMRRKPVGTSTKITVEIQKREVVSTEKSIEEKPF